MEYRWAAERRILLYLSGGPAISAKEIPHCVKEDGVYMPDYIFDENGSIKEIRYDKVTLE